MAQPGDVIVVDGGGDLTNALIGEIMVSEAIAAGIAGFVMDGAIRDVGAIRAGSRSRYIAAGVTHRGPYKDGPGEINVPIAIDGMVVEPGDLIIGDDDGLLCIAVSPTWRWCLKAAQAKHAAEDKSRWRRSAAAPGSGRSHGWRRR